MTRSSRRWLGAALTGALVAGASFQAHADPSNVAPPPGWILSLDGQPITNEQQSYSVTFTAAVAETAITFAFRQDPSFLSFSNVSVVDNADPGVNLILNGDFSQGVVGTNTVDNWTYANIYGAWASGVLAAGCGLNG